MEKVDIALPRIVWETMAMDVLGTHIHISRNKRLPQFYRELDYLQLVLMHYKTGYRVIRRAEAEADDLVEPVLKSFAGKQLHVLLISNDMDWARGISNSADWMTREGERDVIYNIKAFIAN